MGLSNTRRTFESALGEADASAEQDHKQHPYHAAAHRRHYEPLKREQRPRPAPSSAPCSSRGPPPRFLLPSTRLARRQPEAAVTRLGKRRTRGESLSSPRRGCRPSAPRGLHLRRGLGVACRALPCPSRIYPGREISRLGGASRRLRKAPRGAARPSSCCRRLLGRMEESVCPSAAPPPTQQTPCARAAPPPPP